MEFDLSKVDPETPTEAILKHYALVLERRLMACQEEKGFNPHLVPHTETIEASVVEQEGFWRGAVRCSVFKDFECSTLKVRTKLMNNDKSFEVGIYVSREDMLTTTYLGNRTAELYKEGLQHIAKIYEGPK